MDRINLARGLDDRLRHSIERHQPFLTVIHPVTRDDEYRCLELRHLYLVVPAQRTDLLFPVLLPGRLYKFARRE